MITGWKHINGIIIYLKLIIWIKKHNNKDEELLKQQQTSNDTKAAEKSAEADIEKDLDLTPPARSRR